MPAQVSSDPGNLSVLGFASTVQFLCMFQFGRQDKGKSQCPYTDDVTECIVCVLGRDLFTCLSFLTVLKFYGSNILISIKTCTLHKTGPDEIKRKEVVLGPQGRLSWA